MRPTSRGTLLVFLTLLWVFPLALTALAWTDVHHWHYVLVLEDRTDPSAPITPTDLQRLKQSILNVQVPSCDSSASSSGTAFVISEGYVATAAHVVEDHQKCGAEISLVDYRGIAHRAELSAFSDKEQMDLAILSFNETSLEPLALADSTQLESATAMLSVMTIGYPKGSSTTDGAAISGEGNVSSFRNDLFFTSGMDLNPGNSGGPVFLTSNWEVLGLAVAKGDPTQGVEGLGLVLPSATLSRFFQDRTGRPL